MSLKGLRCASELMSGEVDPRELVGGEGGRGRGLVGRRIKLRDAASTLAVCG